MHPRPFSFQTPVLPQAFPQPAPAVGGDDAFELAPGTMAVLLVTDKADLIAALIERTDKVGLVVTGPRVLAVDRPIVPGGTMQGWSA